ncbi:MAG: hypothetical protein ACRDNX_13845, partial [Gaiellaceae bacterium]
FGLAATALSARSGARRDVGRLHRELAEVAAARRERLLALGEAVYLRDEAATESLRAELDELDRTTAAKEAEMAAVIERARARLERAHLEVQATEMVELPGEPGLPQQPTIPEPTPVPHVPPQPPGIPEPSPVPSPAPQPPSIPEPYPEPPSEPLPPQTPESHPGGRSQEN